MKRFKKLDNGYRWDRRLLFVVLAPAFILTIILGVDALTSEYTFHMKVECIGMECDNPWYGNCPWFVERQMPSICEQKTLHPGYYGEKPVIGLEWIYMSFLVGFGLFFSINHLWHNGGITNGD